MSLLITLLLGVRAKVREHRPAQRQARQAKGKRENSYVIKVMGLNREGVTVPWVRENQNTWYIVKIIYIIYINLILLSIM
jgi:hypothetical protein